MTQERSNFASSQCGLIILPSRYASPFPEGGNKLITDSETGTDPPELRDTPAWLCPSRFL